MDLAFAKDVIVLEKCTKSLNSPFLYRIWFLTVQERLQYDHKSSLEKRGNHLGLG